MAGCERGEEGRKRERGREKKGGGGKETKKMQTLKFEL